MVENSYRLYRVPAKLADQHDLIWAGANLRRPDGTFAGQVEPVGSVDIVLSDKLDEALTRLKAGQDQYVLRHLLGGLWYIGSRLAGMERLVRQMASQLAQAQHGVEWLVKKWEDDLSAKIEAVVAILRRADKKKGKDARVYIETHHFNIDVTLKAALKYFDDLYKISNNHDDCRVDVLRQRLLVSHLSAKIFLLLGETEEAFELLDAFRAEVEVEAGHLLREWVAGVDLRDIAPGGSADLDALLLAMEQIDGVGPYERLLNAVHNAPRLPEKAPLSWLNSRLAVTNRDQSNISARSCRNIFFSPDKQSATLLRSGDVVEDNYTRLAVANAGGYRIDLNGDVRESYIIEIPVSRRASSEIGKHIHALARLLIEARNMSAEGAIAMEFPTIAQAIVNLRTSTGVDADHDVLLLTAQQESVELLPSNREIPLPEAMDNRAEERERTPPSEERYLP